MASTALHSLKSEWNHFRHDPAGKRFQNHHARMQRRSRAVNVGGTVLGVLLLAAGVAMLFVPGPGILGIVFGLALVAGRSKKLAAALDRAEPPVRRAARKVLRWWQGLPVIAKIALGVIAAAAAAGVLYGLYRLWFA